MDYGSALAPTHEYADGPHTYAVTVDIVDADATFLNRANALSVIVDNVPPTVDQVASSDITPFGVSINSRSSELTNSIADLFTSPPGEPGLAITASDPVIATAHSVPTGSASRARVSVRSTSASHIW